MNPFIWLAIAALMAVVEVASFGLITMWFVIGALAAFVAHLVGADIVVQMVVFIVVSVVCLVVLRPVAMRYRNKGQSAEPTLVGTAAIVVEDIDNNALVGRVETDNHMSWLARSFDGSIIHAGENVVVRAQESAKLIVERKFT